MSDLFHPGVTDDYIVRIAEVMMKANWHTFQVLTKRAERLRKLLNTKLRFATVSDHIWWGVSVEDRKHGVPRIGELRATPAKVKFLSVEPLLEDLGKLDLSAIDWLIAGGESGRGSRPMREEWVQNLLSQCQDQKVSFFFKQWGGVNKKRTGRLLNGQTYDQLPILQ
jgi:protein gp37